MTVISQAVTIEPGRMDPPMRLINIHETGVADTEMNMIRQGPGHPAVKQGKTQMTQSLGKAYAGEPYYMN